MVPLSHSVTTDWQQQKNIDNVCPISDKIFLQPGPQTIESEQLPTKDSPDSPTPSNRRSTQLYKPYDLHNADLHTTVLSNGKLT